MNMTAIAIVAIVCWAIVELVNGTRSKKTSKKDDLKNTELQQQLVTLKERVETLERIVTDEKYDLNRQFNELKKDRVA
jgi:flagellar biogenesis protein FliO